MDIQKYFFHFLVQNWQEKENYQTFLIIVQFCPFYGRKMDEKIV